MTLEEKIELLQDINAELGGFLQSIQTNRAVGRREIDSEGQISEETCIGMAKMLKQAEFRARQLDTGLKSVHQSMAKFIPEGANEGNKEWPPQP